MRYFLPLFLLLALLIFVPTTLANHSNGKDEQNIPEKDGIYDVDGHPNMKVRVFVHYPREQSNVVVQCTPDVDSQAVVGATGWHLPSQWTYRLNVQSAPVNLASFGPGVFNTWENSTNGDVDFTQGSNTTVNRKGFDGQNIVAWGATSGQALGTTYTWYNTSTNQVVEVDTIMNKKFKWSWGACNTNTYDAQNILTHEVGHWLGLDDEYTSEYVDNTMYGYGARAENKKNTLTTGDVAGVSAIYQ